MPMGSQQPFLLSDRSREERTYWSRDAEQSGTQDGDVVVTMWQVHVCQARPDSQPFECFYTPSEQYTFADRRKRLTMEYKDDKKNLEVVRYGECKPNQDAKICRRQSQRAL